MSADMHQYTREEIESLEVAPGFEHERLEGWASDLETEEALREAVEKAFDYRGDVTLTLKSGERVEGYVFNRYVGATLAESWAQYFVANDPAKHKVGYDQIARIEFTGKDRAAGKHWEDWVKAYNEKKAAGEKNSGLEAETLE